MISHRGISVITPHPSGEGKGEGPLPHRGISVITPLPFGGGEGGGATRGRGRGHSHKPKKLPPERVAALFRYNEYSHEGELH